MGAFNRPIGVSTTVVALENMRMGYEIYGFIGQAQRLKRALVDLPEWQAVQLEQGLGLVPVADPHGSGGTETYESEKSQVQAQFCWLSSRLEALGLLLSNSTPVAYIEAEYFGGTGDQRAVLWENGRVASGPFVQGKGSEINEKLPLEQWPINRVLQLLGATSSGAVDEFEAVGLGRYRHQEDWLNDIDRV